jgi:hypothetical protein
MVTVRDNGVERKMRADQAFVHHVVQKAAAGDPAYRSVGLKLTDAGERLAPKQRRQTIIYRVYADPGDLNHPMRALQVARLMDAYRPTAYMVLEPWLVQRALDRLEDRRLSLEEQQKVVASTRSPHKVRWPEWWSAS